MNARSGKRLLPIRAMCARYGDVADKTIDRWTAAGILPPPLVINKRRYWDEEELEQRERTHMGRNRPARGDMPDNTPDAA
jgi:DNA-binding transcriptional MerR regulator